MPTRSWCRDDGSLVLTLLVAIIVAGLAATLVGTTMTGQRKVRHDRDFQLAINGADAAVQQAVTVISTLPYGAGHAHLDSTGRDTRLGDDIDFEWTARRTSPIAWEIRGTGVRNGVARTVEALAVRDAMFFLAAFADIGFVMRGNNEVRSYNAIHTNTGFGAVGSNGTIEILGNSSWVDLVMLMGPNADCVRNIRCQDRPIHGFSEAFDLNAVAENIEESMNAACAPGDFRAYNASVDGDLRGGQTYCFTTMSTPNHGGFEVVNGSADNPAIVYLTGNFTTGNHSRINCPSSACTLSARPDSAALQIYSLGEQVTIGNHTSIAAAIAAPRANCQGAPSNAQASLYGAIVCKDLRNQGGWNFYFDERLLNLGSGQFDIREWREEPGGTTSFRSGS